MVSGIGGTANLDYMYQMQSMSQNNALSADELFSAIDTDGDGTISKEEFEKHRAERESAIKNKTMNSQNPMSSLMNLLNGSVWIGSLDDIIKAAQSGTVGLQDGVPSADQIFSKLDTDGDGGISQAEFEAHGPMGANQGNPSADKIFSAIDTNGDGTISEEEFEHHHAHRGGGHGGHGHSQVDLASLLESQQTTADDGTTKSQDSDQNTFNGASFLTQALEKYMQFAFAKENATDTGLVNTVG